MKFIQLIDSENYLFALGEDGQVYRLEDLTGPFGSQNAEWQPVVSEPISHAEAVARKLRGMPFKHIRSILATYQPEFSGVVCTVKSADRKHTVTITDSATALTIVDNAGNTVTLAIVGGVMK